MPSTPIKIPPGDIFKYDRLGLKPAIQGRTDALLARSPQAIAIDGRWGTGKSTFLALWAAYLRSQDVKVVQFNAWKSFEADPFNALTNNILNQVKIPDADREAPHQHLLDFMRENAHFFAKGIKLFSILQPEAEIESQAITQGLETAAIAAKSKPNKKTDPKIDSPDAFASALTRAAKTWSDRPVVVMVDELDRCSPEYAVEFLQLLEHVFHTKRVVFVVAINRNELQHLIKSFYGQGFNAEGYLERFFDDILGLPTSRRSEYIKTSVEPIASVNTSNALLFLEASDLSLRETDKSVEVLDSAVKNRPQSAHTLLFLWIARTLAPAAFRQFLAGDISDKELVDVIFLNGNCASLRVERPSYELYTPRTLEIILMLCSGMFSRGPLWAFCENPGTISELFKHYNEIVTKEVDGQVSIEYAQEVLDLVSRQSKEANCEQYVGEIIRCARLLEREFPSE